jgi:hypothetical protein
VEVGVQITDVRYTITNFGVDVGDKAEARYFPQGPDDLGSITWAPSGKPARLPAGTYNVHITFADGDAKKEIWFDNQSFSGTVEKAVEVGVKTTDVRYGVTNNGVDTEGKSRIDYFPGGTHGGGSDTHAGGINWTNSGKTVRLPERTYDVRVQFTDGDAHKEMWFDNQSFSGKVEKTMEVGVKTTDVSYVVTNNGVDTGDKARIDYFPGGSDENGIDWTNSGRTVRLPEGTYNVRVQFTDGEGHREKWLDNQVFSGKADRTVEIGVQLTDVHTIVTNGVVDVGQKARIDYFPGGKRDGGIDWTASDKSVRLAEGRYNMRVVYDYGLAHEEMRFENQALSGKVDKTGELGLTLAQPTVTVSQNGTDSRTRIISAPSQAGRRRWSRPAPTTSMPRSTEPMPGCARWRSAATRRSQSS